jgi:NADPH-dependent 2,4-dienoyl-CoA reductase/sulfur reductase-like enzyme
VTDTETRARTEVRVNGESYLLAPGQDIDALRQRIEDVARHGAAFVDFIAAGDRPTAVLVSGRTEVVIASQWVTTDEHGSAPEDEPFEAFYDL